MAATADAGPLSSRGDALLVRHMTHWQCLDCPDRSLGDDVPAMDRAEAELHALQHCHIVQAVATDTMIPRERAL